MTTTIERTGSTWKAVVRHTAGTSVSYDHPSREAAQASADRMAAKAPVAEPVSGRQSFRVAGAGRLAGR